MTTTSQVTRDEDIDERPNERQGAGEPAAAPYSTYDEQDDQDAVTQALEAPLGDQEWMVQFSPTDRRLMSRQGLLNELKGGETLDGNTLVWRGGMDGWAPIHQVEALAPGVPSAGMPPAPVAAAGAAPPPSENVALPRATPAGAPLAVSSAPAAVPSALGGLHPAPGAPPQGAPAALSDAQDSARPAPARRAPPPLAPSPRRPAPPAGTSPAQQTAVASVPQHAAVASVPQHAAVASVPQHAAVASVPQHAVTPPLSPMPVSAQPSAPRRAVAPAPPPSMSLGVELLATGALVVTCVVIAFWVLWLGGVFAPASF